MTDYSVVIDIILNGLQQIDDLADGVRRLRGAAREGERAARSLSAVDDQSQSLTKSQVALGKQLQANQAQIARYAIASARLRQAQGDQAGAVKVLQDALSELSDASVEALRVQTALVNVQNNYANSPLISAVRGQTREFGGLADAAGRSKQQLEQAQKQAEKTSDSFNDGTKSIERQRDALGRFTSSTGVVGADVGDLTDAVKELKEVADKPPAREGFIHGLLTDLNSVTVVITAVTALFDLLEAASKHTDSASPIVKKVAAAIVGGFGGATSATEAFNVVVNKVTETVDHLGDVAAASFGKVDQSQKAATKSTHQTAEEMLAYIARVNQEIIANSKREESERRFDKARQSASQARATLFQTVLAQNQRAREQTAVLEGAEKRYADAIRLTVTQAEQGARKLSAFQKAKEAVLRFLREEEGSFSLLDFLQGIERAATRAAPRVQAAFAGLRGSVGQIFSPQVKQQASEFFRRLADGSPLLQGLEQRFNALKGTATEALEGLGSEAALTGVAIGGLTLGVAALVTGLITMAAIATAGAAALVFLGTSGVKANAELEQVQLGIATIIASVGKLRDDRGVEIKGVDALNAALPIARDQLDKLRVDALETALDFSQLAPAFLQAIGPGLAAGLQLDQIRKTVKDVAQIVGPLTGHVEQLGQELRSLFTGDIGPDSGVAKALGITKKMVDEAKKNNTLADLLNEKLKVAAATGKLMAGTFEAAASNLREAGTFLAAQVSEGFFQKLKNKVNEKLPQIFDTSQGTVQIAERFRGLADTFEEVFNKLGDLFSDTFDFIFDTLSKFSDFLDKNRDEVNLLIDTVDLLARAFGDVAKEIISLLGGNAANILRFIIDQVADFVRVVGLLRDLWELVGAAGALALTTIVGGIFEAADALKFLGIHIEGAAEGLAKAEAKAAELRNRLNEGFVNARKLDAELNRLQNQSKIVTDFGNAVEVDPKTGKPIGRVGVITDKFSTVKPFASVSGATQVDKDKKAKVQREVRDNAQSTLQAEQALRRAISALKLAFAEKDQQAAKDALQRETALLDEALEDRKISLTDYFNRKDELIQKSTELEIAAIRRQIQFERERFADIEALEAEQRAQAEKDAAADLKHTKTKQQRAAIERNLANELKAIATKSETERLAVDKKIIELEKELAQAESKGATEEANNIRRRIAARRELLRAVEDAGTELKRLTGQELAAELDAIDQRFEELLTKVRLNFKAGSRELQTLLDLIAKLKQNARLDEDIRQARLSRSVTDAERGLAEVQVQNRVVAGLLTERQARREILAIQRAYAAQVLPSLNAEIEALKLRGAEYRAQVIELEAQREALKQLTIDTEAANRRVARSLEEGLRNAIEGIGDQIKTLGDFAKTIVDSILAEMKRLVADEVIDLLFGGKRNSQGEVKQGPIPRIIDAIFGKRDQQNGEAGGVAGAVTGAFGGGAGTQLQATNQNTQATNLNTQALNAVVTSLGGQPVGGAGGGLLGGLVGGIVGLFTGGGGGGGGGDTGGFITQGEFGTQPFPGQIGAGDVGGGEGGGIGSFFSGLLGDFLGGGVGQASNVMDGLNTIIQLLNKIAQNTGQGAGGGGGLEQLISLAAAGGFAEGGFTFGSVGQPAGVVHGGEFVFNDTAVSNLGLPWLSAVHQAAQHGFETGGAVHRDFASGTQPSALPLPIGQSAAPVVNVRNVNVFSEDDVASAMTGPVAEVAFLNFMSRRAPEIKSRLKIKG